MFLILIASTFIASLLGLSVASAAELSFLPPVQYEVGRADKDNSSVAVADLNGDNISDLVVASQLGTIFVLIGNGDGTFEAPTGYPGGATFVSVAVADINHDGILDFAAADVSLRRILVRLGNGDGTFGAQAVFGVVTDPRTVLFADLDNDGNLDLIGSGGSVITTWMGIGNGNFQFPRAMSSGGSPVSAVAADVNNDGNIDVVTNVTLLLGNGDGTFAAPRNIGGDDQRGVAVGDLNQDGKLDVVIVGPQPQEPLSQNRAGTVLIGNGDGTFEAPLFFGPVRAPRSVIIADFNEDGISDLVVASGLRTATILQGNNNGTFGTTTIFEVGGRPLTILSSDINADQLPDIVTGDEDGTVSVVINHTGVNNAPVLNPIGNQTVNEGQTLQFTLSATDPDGNNLTYSAANLPPGASFDPQTATFTWTPGFNQAGNYPNVEFTVTDDGDPMELDVELITITVGDINRAPVFDAVGTQEVVEGAPLTFTVSATDPDNDALVLSINGLLDGASFDAQTGEFNWTPTLSQSGTYIVTFEATDNGSPSLVGTTDVVITVGDNPTPVEQAQNLIDVVIGFNFPPNVENSYLANLKKIQKFIEDGKVTPAINQLDAFINKVEQDFSQAVITQSEHETLVSLAEALRADLQ